MAVETYRWPAAGEFRDRTRERAQLERWWNSPSREPINLYGRRRVGKSWLFRKVADGKPAVILVADRVATGQQLSHLADQLAPVIGVKPQLDTVADLFTVLYDLAAQRKVLVVIDEFPYLLGTTIAEQQRALSSIQAVMERKRESSKIKLILTGSTIGQMEALQAERSPLHGRLVPLPLWPMTFGHATKLLVPGDPIDQFSRYAVAGGMPRYLQALGQGDLAETLADVVADPHGQLFNEPRTLLQTELREPAVYFSILAELAGKPQDVSTIAAGLRLPTRELSRYLTTLESLRLIVRRQPVGAESQGRRTQWQCTDHFVRFWFRFIQPFQPELEAGADPRAHIDRAVMPQLSDHTAPVFEDAVASWVRRRHEGASAVGGWWGPALHRLRVTKERFTEEIDVVALRGKSVACVAEAKWTTKPLGAAVLSDLIEYKLPALAQAGLDPTGAEIILASRSGFTDGARKLAAQTASTVLVDAHDLLRDLIPTEEP